MFLAYLSSQIFFNWISPLEMKKNYSPIFSSKLENETRFKTIEETTKIKEEKTELMFESLSLELN